MTKRAQPQRQKRRGKKVLLLLGAAALFLLFLWNLQIGTIHVNGADFYTEQELADFIFETPLEKNVLYAWLNNRFGDAKTIPFVAGYTVEFNGLGEVTVSVYEKKVVGYIDYMGSHMYFDKDGTVVESSSQVREGIPLITGLSFDYIVLYKKLPVESETAFTEILNLTQLISKYDLSVDKIHFDNRFHATLYMGGVRVRLGGKDSMEDKIAELHGMMAVLENDAGELSLADYDKTAMNPGYYFIRDAAAPLEAEPETAASGKEAEPTAEAPEPPAE